MYLEAAVNVQMRSGSVFGILGMFRKDGLSVCRSFGSENLIPCEQILEGRQGPLLARLALKGGDRIARSIHHLRLGDSVG